MARLRLGGSDAVAGVVNIIIDQGFTGVSTKLEGSISQYGDTFEHKEEVAGGASFAGGRGHIVGSFSYSDRPRFTFQRQRNWPEDQGYGHTIADNPNYTPTNGQTRLLRFTGVGTANQTPGGLITSGPLKGTQFVGPEGVPATYVGTNIGGTRAIGRDVDLPIYDNGPLTNTLRTANVYSSVTYQINDNLDADLELNYGLSEGGQVSIYYTRPGNLTIFADNAYLPTETRAAMAANNITSFALGKNHVETGMLLTEAYRTLYRGVAGLKGTVFDGWKWNAYYSHGETRNSSKFKNNPLVPRYNLAVDAVLNPATGQIVCRSTLTNPGNGCVPFDVFGTKPQTAAAKDWVFGVPGYQVIHLKQDVVAASISGSPFEIWAGPVDIAFGAEARWDGANAVSDEFSRARSYAAGNTQSLAPVEVGVKEAFFETNIPLVKDAAWAQSLDFNAAVRVTDYSTSGVVATWKAGLSYQINDDLRLRGTRSRDIRAPTMNELFSPGQIQTTTQFDPFSQTTLVARSNFSGNPNLKPEVGDTWTAGVVYQPAWLAGFQASVDYYDIQIKDAIQTPTWAQVIFGCYTQQFPQYCPLVHFNAQGVAETVDLIGVNIAQARTRGVDLETSYRLPLGPGDLSLRAMFTYNIELSTVENGIYVDSSGIVGGASEGTAGGIPKTKVVGRAQYDIAPFMVSLEAQFSGAATLNRAWTAADLRPEDNRVDSHLLFNLRTAYEFEALGSDSRLYLSIDNVLNTAPPVVASRADGRGGTAIAPTFSYERLGRMFRLGLRSKF